MQSIGVTAGIGLAGCIGGFSNDKIDFHFIAATPEEGTQEVLTDAVEDWAETLDDHEIEPVMEFVDTEGAEPALNEYLGTGQPPTLVMGNLQIARFHDSLVDTTEFNEDVIDLPNPIWGGPIGDYQVVIPDHFIVMAKYYRMDLYDEAGVEPPETWEEQLTVLESLNDEFDGEMYPELVMTNPDTTATYLQNHMTHHTLGVDFIERTGDNLDDVHVSLGDDDEREAAIDILSHYNEVYDYSPETEGYGIFDMVTTYVEEAVATSNYSGRMIDNITNLNPDLLEDTGVTRYPMPEGVDDYKMGAIPQVIAVPESEHSSLAFDFLEHYFTTDHYFNRLTGAGPNAIPITEDLFRDDRLLDQEAWQNPVAEQYFEYVEDLWEGDNFFVAQYGRTDPPSLYWPALMLDAGYSMELSANGFTGRMSPEEAVDNVVEGLESDLMDTVEEYV